MKILVLPSFHQLMGDPVPRANFTWEQTVLFKKYGLDVDFLYNEDRSIKDYSFRENLRNLRKYCFQKKMYIQSGVKIYLRHDYKFFPFLWRVGQKYWIWRTVDLFENFYLKHNSLPDLIHVHFSLPAAEVAAIIKKKYGVPFTVVEHSSFFGSGKYSEKDLLNIENALNVAEKIVCVSNPFKDLLISKLRVKKDNFLVIPNFIDTDFFSPLQVDVHKKAKKFTFLCICHLETKKRVDRLIKAFINKFSNTPDVCLRIGGTGSQNKFLQDLILEIDVNQQILMLGPLSREKVREEFASCDVFVLPSEVETFGIVLIEAMAMGKPVIATKCGGPEDFIDDSVGVIVNRNDVDLAEEMMKMKNNISHYNPINLTNFVFDRFSSQVVVDRYNELFLNILKKND